MKKNPLIAIIAFICCVFILSACSFGFAPAWKAKNDTATVSLKFSAIDDSEGTSSDRAIIQGGGYLYIRTIGGPSGGDGGYYGPYQIKGTNFTTNDIPAGTYTHIALLYSADNMDAMTFDYKGKVFTFPQLMQQSDDEVLLLFTDGDNGPEPTEASEALLEEGSLSMCLTGTTIIKAGTTNTISTTLLPNTQTTVDMETNPYYEFTPILQNRLTKKFIRLINVNPGTASGTTTTELVCQIKPTDGPATIGIVALYNEEGKLVKSFPSSGNIAEGTAISFSTPYTSGSTFYLYFECQGAKLNFDFPGAGSSGNFTVSITGASAHIGKKVNFGLFSTVPGVPGGFPDVAGGTFTIGTNGSGTALAKEVANNTTHIAPGAYYLFAFIDVNGNAGPGLGPDWGDLVLTGTGYTAVTVTTGITEKNLTLANFTGYQPYPGTVYYVSNSGGGLGTSPIDTCTLTNALNTIIPGSGVTAPNFNIIVLTEHITDMYNGSYSINKPVVITSMGGPWTITLGMTHSGSYIGIIASGTLILEKAGISAAPPSFMANMSLVSIATSGKFIMKSGSLVKDNKVTMTGGSSGVVVNGGTFVMEGGVISGCDTSATATGGAVLVNTGTFTMNGGQISTNTAQSSNGGGVTVVNGTVTMTGGTISGNSTSSNGGGISIAMGTFTMTGGSISGNSASGTGGGGIYLASGTTLTCVSACSITGNSASAGMGGGLYASGATIFFNGVSIGGGNSGLLNGSIFNTNTASSSAEVYVN